MLIDKTASAVERGTYPLPIDRLQQRRRAGGAVLETPARPAATGRDDWSRNRT